MGTFFITSFSSTFTTNSASISIQGKDKMCLLNGELGGIINAETDFGTYDYTDANGVTTNYKLTIQEIVTDLIYSYAQEPLSNIIIQDLDDVGLEQLDYKNDDPMFLIRSFTSERYVLPLFSSADVTVYCCKEIGKDQYKFSVQKLNNDKVIIYDSLTRPLLDNNYIATRFTFEEMDETQTYTAEQLNQMQLYCAAKITYGEAVGYRTCPLVYAGDLIAKAGDTITSVLDKIIKMLGEFEYFYDVDGRFVLRHKKSFINTVWLPEMVTISSDEGRDRYWLDYQYATPYIYEFKDTKLITNVQNSPQLASIKMIIRFGGSAFLRPVVNYLSIVDMLLTLSQLYMSVLLLMLSQMFGLLYQKLNLNTINLICHGLSSVYCRASSYMRHWIGVN